jgi:hypothetical protein
VPSAEIHEPPSPSKLALIRRFLCAAEIQHRIDTGNFLDRFAMPGGPVLASAALGDADTLREAVDASLAALRAAYETRRHIWQEEYESHVNWEFTEEELKEIVAFLEKPVGAHFLEGRWRMDAYIGSNVEELVDEIVAEAEAAVSGG